MSEDKAAQAYLLIDVGHVLTHVAYIAPVEGAARLVAVAEASTTPAAAGGGLLDGLRRAVNNLELLIGQGVVALNIIPDRNWNLTDPEVKRVKVQKLYEVVELAQKLDLPLNIGTEMNAYGQKLVDDFNAPELAPVRDVFIDGAYFIYGHTVAQRALGRGYQSDWAKSHLPSRRDRNAFYTRLGRQVEPGKLEPANLETIIDNLLSKQA